MYHRLLLGYTIMHLILKGAVLRGFITEPPPSSRPFVVETYLILESELVNRTERRGNNAKEYAAFVMEVVTQILQQLNPPGKMVLRTIEIKTPDDDYAVFTDGNIVDAPKTLRNVANHAKSNIEMQRADAVIYLVGRDMIHRRPDGSTFLSHGLAFTKGACTTHNVVIAADNGNKYTGAMSVAHEIGHLIGSSHDGSEFAPDCPRNAGTIMVPQAVGEIRARFSNCSREAISTFLNWTTKTSRVTSFVLLLLKVRMMSCITPRWHQTASLVTRQTL
ncbi:venom metalloproteinase antarease-like TpachMP_B isoform X2 [Rhipicephalus microplus]|uniref:venom metalloproteinase antarease-like TpachMP_B isoform X2 n=1 Tax=Rhipicephalus microplus TaxID=6941 RepID=UPI003F6B084D